MPASIAAHVAPAPSAARSRLTAAWNAALDRFIADPAIADRRPARRGQREDRAREARHSERGAARSAPRDRAYARRSRADRETTDVYARQSAISGAAEILAEAGLLAESDALLTRELARSHSPYYFMLGLAANAKKRGDKAGALDWAEKAYAAAKGPRPACSGV